MVTNGNFNCVAIVTDCQESLRRSFELGVQIGIYRHTRDLLSWSKKRRRRIARDEMIAHLCGKAVPATRLRSSQTQFAKTPVKSTSASTLARFASVDTVEPDLQLFHDALAVHGKSLYVCHYQRDLPRSGKLPVLNLLRGQKLAFFAPRGRLDVSIQVKFGTAEGHVGMLGHPKFHTNL